MSLVDHDHVVEKLSPNRADHSLGVGVLPGRAWCREHLGYAHASHPSPKLAAIDVVAIAQEVTRRRVIGKRFDNLLRCPGGSGGIGYAEVYDSSAMLQQDHKNVEHPEGRSRHNEEVDGDEVRKVVLEERAPGLRGWLRATRDEPGNGALRDFEAEFEQLAVNAWRAPKWIRERHGTHEIRKLGADPWPTHPPAA